MIIISKIYLPRSTKAVISRSNVYVMGNDDYGLGNYPFIFRETHAIHNARYNFNHSNCTRFKREAAGVAGVNVVSLMPIPRRGCAPVNRVNRVQGNQCARETRPVAERTHHPFYLFAALKLAHPVRASHPRQYRKLAQFSNRCCFPSSYFSSIHFPMYMYRLRSRVEIRDSLKIVAPSWKKNSLE